MMKKTLSVFLIAIIFLPPSMWADQFEMRNGKKYEGKILTEDTQGLFLETSEGMINLPKMNLLTVNGQPYHYAGQGTAFVDPSKAPAGPVYLGQVSPAGQDAGAVEQGQNVGVQFVSVDQLGKPSARPAIKKPAVPGEGVAVVIHPSGVTEADLKAYYQNHAEEFRMPAQLRLKFINNPMIEELQQKPEEILRNPAASTAWQDAGWVQQCGGISNVSFPPEAYDRIYSLREGEACLVYDTDKMPYLFWAELRKKAYLIPYAEARTKVLTQVLKARS